MSNYYDDCNDVEESYDDDDDCSDGNENKEDNEEDDENELLEDDVIYGDEIESKENEDEINENVEFDEIGNEEIENNDDDDDVNNDNDNNDNNYNDENNDSDEDYYNFKMNEIKSSKLQPILEISKQHTSIKSTTTTKKTKSKIKSEISLLPSPSPTQRPSTIETNRHKLNWDIIEKRAIYNYILPQTRIYKQMSRGVPAVASKMLVNLFKVKSFKSAYIIPEINRNECFYNRTSNNVYNKK